MSELLRLSAEDNIVLRPIKMVQIETAKWWLGVLCNSNLNFHLEDNVYDVFEGKLTPINLKNLESNVCQLYNEDFHWGHHGCPIGYLTWLMNQQDMIDPNTEVYERYWVRSRAPWAIESDNEIHTFLVYVPAGEPRPEDAEDHCYIDVFEDGRFNLLLGSGEVFTESLVEAEKHLAEWIQTECSKNDNKVRFVNGTKTLPLDDETHGELEVAMDVAGFQEPEKWWSIPDPRGASYGSFHARRSLEPDSEAILVEHRFDTDEFDYQMVFEDLDSFKAWASNTL